MFYTICLYASLAIFSVGCLYKISNWFRHKVDYDARHIPTTRRFTAAARAVGATVFSSRVVELIVTFLRDGLFQHWLWRKDRYRWAAHFCIYAGFTLLLLMHALDAFVAPLIFSDYYPTLNPFLFLRNLFGLIVLAGIVLVIFRRGGLHGPKPKTSARDSFAILLLTTIMLSGTLLEAFKISSQSEFDLMTADYAGIRSQEDPEYEALSAYWIAHFGVVIPGRTPPFEAALLREGEDLHQMNCMQCHDRPQWAFISYGLSRIMRSAAAPLDQANAVSVLLHLHFLACFIGLAYLPFSKFFHIFASPLFLMACKAQATKVVDPANRATLRALSLDACTHCSDCTARCSVAAAAAQIPNPGILPSEKLSALGRIVSGRGLSKKRLIQIQEASHICTDCHRCTDVCSMGIDLAALWADLKRHTADLGYTKPEAWARKNLSANQERLVGVDVPLAPAPDGATFLDSLAWTAQTRSFTACFDCRNCTNACPVVAMYASPRKVLGLLPHEIMHYLALKQPEPVLAANMLWACTTCYLCQEQCPQGVYITDLFYQLKNMALQQMKEEACNA